MRDGDYVGTDLVAETTVDELVSKMVGREVGDLFPKTAAPDLGACPGSNYGEMFYMLAADPQGTINGNARSKTYVSDATIGTLAHEFQHLINSSRRLYVNNANTFETVWLDEGLAHIAEELNFYTASGLSPRQDLDQNAILSSTDRINAFNEFQINNFGRLARPVPASFPPVF